MDPARGCVRRSPVFCFPAAFCTHFIAADSQLVLYFFGLNFSSSTNDFT